MFCPKLQCSKYSSLKILILTALVKYGQWQCIFIQHIWYLKRNNPTCLRLTVYEMKNYLKIATYQLSGKNDQFLPLRHISLSTRQSDIEVEIS